MEFHISGTLDFKNFCMYVCMHTNFNCLPTNIHNSLFPKLQEIHTSKISMCCIHTYMPTYKYFFRNSGISIFLDYPYLQKTEKFQKISNSRNMKSENMELPEILKIHVYRWTSMYVYMHAHVCMCICNQTCISVCICMYVFMHGSIYVYINLVIHVGSHTWFWINSYKHVCVCVYTCISVHMYMHTYTHAFSYIHIYVHIHTCIHT